VFVQKGPLYLVAVSSTGEPPSALERQLVLVHAQILCILTNHFDRMLARNPRFDSRRLLGETTLLFVHLYFFKITNVHLIQK
jgi:hypothetical protein